MAHLLRPLAHRACLAGALLAGLHASAQAPKNQEPTVDEQLAQRHRFGLSLPTVIRAQARFMAARATNPGPAPGLPVTLADGRVDRLYDDGYNRVNSLGNPVLLGAPATTFFGYANDAQVNNVVGAGTLDLHSVRLNGGDYTRKLDNQPFPGVELFYHFDWKARQHWRLGFELGVAYHYFKWEQNGAPNSQVNLLTDGFALNGVPLGILPPATQFDGVFTPVPGSSVVGSTPTRTEATVPAAVTGVRKLELHALQFRLGPALDWVPNDRWLVGVQGGLACGVGVSQLGFAERITVTAPNIAPVNQSGQSADTHAWAGWFSALRINRRLGERWDAHVEVRHTWMQALQHTAPSRAGEINLTDGIGLGGGVSYRF